MVGSSKLLPQSTNVALNYRFIVPSIGGMVALTFLALLFRR